MKLTAKGIELLRSPLGVMLMIPASHNHELAKIDKEFLKTFEVKFTDAQKEDLLDFLS